MARHDAATAAELLAGAAELLARAVEAIRRERAEAAVIARHEVDAYGVPEAAKRLGISETSLHRRLKAGDIPSVQVGARRLISATAIDEYLRRNEVTHRPRPLRGA